MMVIPVPNSVHISRPSYATGRHTTANSTQSRQKTPNKRSKAGPQKRLACLLRVGASTIPQLTRNLYRRTCPRSPTRPIRTPCHTKPVLERASHKHSRSTHSVHTKPHSTSTDFLLPNQLNMIKTQVASSNNTAPSTSHQTVSITHDENGPLSFVCDNSRHPRPIDNKNRRSSDKDQDITR